MNKKGNLSRRTFLKASTGAAALSTLAPVILSLSASKIVASPSPLNKWPGRVVINYNNTHSAGTNNGSDSDKTILMKMVDDAIKQLTGQTTVGEAWKSLFPTLTASTKIALKVNFNYNQEVPPHPFVVAGITEGLKLMPLDNGTFPAGNIYMYESQGGGSFDGAGYTSDLFPSPINRIAQDSLNTHDDDPGAGDRAYADTLYNCQYLINVPGIRGHGSEYGSVTMGFKSHFGTYSPNHSGNFPEYHRDINCTGPVYNKTVLTVFGGIYALNQGHGPGGSADNFSTYAKTMDPSTGSTRADTIIMSTDPVAAEFQAIKVQKINRKSSYAVSALPVYLQASGGVAGSLSTVYNIGTIDEAQMNIQRIINGVSMTATESISDKPLSGFKLLVYPNPARHNAYFEFWTPVSLVGTKTLVEVYNLQGKLMFRDKSDVLGACNHAAWNGCTNDGKSATPGVYIVNITMGKDVLHGRFTLAK